MDQSKLDFFKRKIKRNYKFFTGERTDGKATLMDVLKPFNIFIDEERTDDYSIECIDFSVPSIKVIDKKTKTTYVAKYTNEVELLNYSGAMEFNNVISTNPIREEINTFFIGHKIPIISQMTFTQGEYELVFIKERPNSVRFQHWVRFKTKYQKNINVEGENYKQILLTRIFDNQFYIDASETREFFYTYNADYNNFIEKNDNQDIFIYNRENGIVYGVDNIEVKEICNLYGVCLESTNVDLKVSIPTCINIEDFSQLTKESGSTGSIAFQGYTDRGIHSLGMYKREWLKRFTIDYYLTEHTYENEKWHDETLICEHFDLPILEEGNITNEEVENIRIELKKRFPNDAFIQIILDELAIFKQKIEIRKGLVEEELDPLSPKLLTNKSFEEICDLVSANKEEYFKLIREQFESATNIAQAKENGQSRILKPSTPQE